MLGTERTLEQIWEDIQRFKHKSNQKHDFLSVLSLYGVSGKRRHDEIHKKPICHSALMTFVAVSAGPLGENTENL